MTKRIVCLFLSCLLFASFTISSSNALGLGDMFGGLFGTTSKDSDDELPSFDNAFSGKMVSVTINGKTLKIHENFKLAMDKYEEFFDEYIVVIKNPTSMEYLTFLTKYTEAMTALETIDESAMSDAELTYYTAVLLRIDEKLLAALDD